MAQLYFRTESIRNEELPKLIVTSSVEDTIISSLMTNANVIVEGSRGTGKSFLMRYACHQLEQSFKETKILPVYITFMASTLIYTDDLLQFRNWMLARIIREIDKSCSKHGIIVGNYASRLLNFDNSLARNKLSEIITLYESSYKSSPTHIDVSILPEVNDIIDAINEICQENNLNGIYLYFDEAAHVFRPEQQRQFFTLFRDFRSPYLSSKAAVYPGVTHFGDSFEITHDAVYKKIDRSLRDNKYFELMKQMVDKQIDDTTRSQIASQKDLFNTVIAASGGNPRILLKSIERLPKIQTKNVDDFIRNFYRSEIWAEHTALGDKFKGHRVIVDWGRKFIEETVLPNLEKNNTSTDDNIRDKTTIFFWIHKDSPILVQEALRLLCYTGIIKKLDDGVKGARSNIGTRYEIKYGILLSQFKNPSKTSKEILNRLQADYFVEYSKNHISYSELSKIDSQSVLLDENEASLEKLREILSKPIEDLDLTKWQLNKLKNEANLTTVKELLDIEEETLISNLSRVGEVRARQMRNAAVAELLEYISG